MDFSKKHLGNIIFCLVRKQHLEFLGVDLKRSGIFSGDDEEFLTLEF